MVNTPGPDGQQELEVRSEKSEAEAAGPRPQPAGQVPGLALNVASEDPNGRPGAAGRTTGCHGHLRGQVEPEAVLLQVFKSFLVVGDGGGL